MSFANRLCVLLVACYAPVAYAQSLTVTSASDGPPDGECVIDCTLREAVALVGTGGTISFAAGLAGSTITLTQGRLLLTRPMTISAPTSGARVTVSGGGASQVFEVEGSATVSITGLTMTGGTASATGDYAGYGGAILSFGTLSLTDCTVSNSTADNGGGIASIGTLTMTRCTVADNTGTFYAGGIYLEGGATIQNSTISGNAAQQGGGIYKGGEPLLVIDNSTISNNPTSFTATPSAVMHEVGTTTIRNSLLTGASSRVIAVRAGTLNMTNTVIYQSVSGASEPCFLVQPAPAAQLGVHANNLIYAQTASPRCEAEFTSDPLLGPLADNGGPTQTHLPLGASPLIDNGDAATCAALPGGNLDQRGLPRFDGDGDTSAECDIGPVEVQSGELPVELVSFEAVRDGAGTVLRWTTASETNNAGFHVEQRGGAAWTEIAYVAGRGTTSERTSYSHALAGLAPGVHAFRLRQVDFDGTASYSPVVEVAVGLEAGSLVEVRGASVRFVVREAQPVRAELYTVLGQRVATLFDGEVPAGKAQMLDVPAGLGTGVYLVRVTGRSVAETARVVVR